MSVSVLDKSVATSSSVGSVSIYDTETMKETDWLPCHDDAECWIVTLGQNKQMFTGGDDSYFRLWVRTNKNRNSTRKFEGVLLHVLFLGFTKSRANYRKKDERRSDKL